LQPHVIIHESDRGIAVSGPMGREEDIRYHLTVPARSDDENAHSRSATHEFSRCGFPGL
jgi:hypothetical protein